MGAETPARTAPGEMDVHFGKNNELILWRQIKIKKFRTIIDKVKVQIAQQQAWFKELERKSWRRKKQRGCGPVGNGQTCAVLHIGDNRCSLLFSGLAFTELHHFSGVVVSEAFFTGHRLGVPGRSSQSTSAIQ